MRGTSCKDFLKIKKQQRRAIAAIAYEYIENKLERCPSWLKEHDWKSCVHLKVYRGFESLSLRHFQ